MPSKSVYSAENTTESLQSDVSGIRRHTSKLLASTASAWVCCGWNWLSFSSGLVA